MQAVIAPQAIRRTTAWRTIIRLLKATSPNYS